MKAALKRKQSSPWFAECVAGAKHWLCKTLVAQQKFDEASDVKEDAFEICRNMLPEDVQLEDSEEFFDQLVSIWDGKLTGKLKFVPANPGASQE